MTVYKDEKTNTWYAQFYYKDWDGKRKHTTKRGFTKKGDAAKYEAQFILIQRKEIVTFKTLLDTYLSNLYRRVKLNTIRESTVVSYEDVINNYIKPFISADITIDKISADYLNDWLVKLVTEYESIRHKNLSHQTVNLAKIQLSSIFNFAVRKKFLASNPMRDAERLSAPPIKEKTVWNLDQYLLFYNSIQQLHHKVIFNLMFFGGLRIGEVMALTPSDINSDGTITVKKSVIRIKGKNVDSKVKTPSSERVISVPKMVFDQLVNYANSLYGCSPTDKLFNFNRTTVSKFLDYHIEKLGLPRLTPHGLRHSNASVLLNLTHDITLVSKRLGHKNPKITLQIYSHMVPGAEKLAIEKLDKLIESKDSTITIPTKVIK